MGSCYASKTLEIAESFLGYEEGSNNWTVFAQELDSVNYFNSKKQNVAWCGTYCYDMIFKACFDDSNPDYDNSDRKWDCLYFTYQPSRDNAACGCRYGANYFRNNGAWHSVKEAKKGDVIFFGPYGAETHQGLVRFIDGGRVYTIEGNSGNAVRHKDYDLNDSYISGIGRPRYDDEPEPTPPTPPEPKEKYQGPWVEFPIDGRNYIQRYDCGEQVVRLQKFLVWLLGEDCLPCWGIDGECGTETMNAVRAAQSVLGVTVDGFYGTKTQAAAQNFER